LDKVTSVTYDADGNQLSVRDPKHVGADMLYDALGRNTQRTDTFGDVTKTLNKPTDEQAQLPTWDTVGM
jgi:YD repeat-containing protein